MPNPNLYQIAIVNLGSNIERASPLAAVTYVTICGIGHHTALPPVWAVFLLPDSFG
jgi:hypothetical protein